MKHSSTEAHALSAGAAGATLKPRGSSQGGLRQYNERVAEAVLSLLPLDEAVAQPVACMHVSGMPEGWRSALQRRLVTRLHEAGWARPEQVEAVERFAFYDRVLKAHAIVLTGEPQPYANFVFKKGVIGEALVH